jgi:hypothetical protein
VGRCTFVLARAGSSSVLWDRSLVFYWYLRVSSGGSRRSYLNQTAPLELADCLSLIENMAEKAQSRLDAILTEAA